MMKKLSTKSKKLTQKESETDEKIDSALSSLESLYEFYKEIPEEKWTIASFSDGTGAYCALGHLGFSEYSSKFEETRTNRLFELFNRKKKDESVPDFIAEVNDGDKYKKYKKPKTRILAFIKDTMIRRSQKKEKI